MPTRAQKIETLLKQYPDMSRNQMGQFLGYGRLVNNRELKNVRKALTARFIKWSEYWWGPTAVYVIVDDESIKRLPRGTSSEDPKRRPYLPSGPGKSGWTIYDVWEVHLQGYGGNRPDLRKKTKTFDKRKK